MILNIFFFFNLKISDILLNKLYNPDTDNKKRMEESSNELCSKRMCDEKQFDTKFNVRKSIVIFSD